MQGFLYTAYIVAIALCVFSTAMLVGRKAGPDTRLTYFTAYLGLESLCFVFEILISHPSTPMKALWLGLLMVTSLLIAPSLWLAIRENLEEARPTLSSLNWKHWAVIGAGALLVVPLIQTTHLGIRFDDPMRAEPTLFANVIHETMLLCIGVFAIQAPFYLLRCRRLLMEDRGSAQRWLLVPLVIVGTTWLSGILRTIIDALSDGGQQAFALLAFLDVLVTIGCVYYIMRRLTGVEVGAAARDFAAGDAACAKYAKSQLDEPIRTRIVTKLTTAFQKDALYCDGGLSLGALSRHINENEHYVSQVLNQELRTTFYEFVNAHRIEHAKRLLIAVPDRNVLEVALEVGFNAKSTFNNAFKRHAGMTPREFRSESGGSLA